MAVKEDTIVLVTGANSGLGRGVAERLARETNYHVIIASRNPKAGKEIADTLTAEGRSASSVQLDLASDDSITAAVNHIETKYGRLDVLINNAGILIDNLRDTMTTRQLFTRTFDTNITGTAVLTELCLPLLRKSQLPRLIFVSSAMGSLQISTDKTTAWYPIDYKAYDASKAATNMLAINYDRSLSDVGGLVNTVCPGLVRSNLSVWSQTNGESPEVGAQRVIELATAEKGSASATFSNAQGPLPW